MYTNSVTEKSEAENQLRVTVDRQGRAKREPVKTILLAGRDEHDRRRLAHDLRREDYRVLEVRDGIELVDYLVHAFMKCDALVKPDVIVSDDTLPGWTGCEVCARLRTFNGSVPFLLLTGNPHGVSWELGRRVGADFLFEKPVDWDMLLETLDVLTQKGSRLH
jgi:CheY-like chemotaxis protein